MLKLRITFNDQSIKELAISQFLSIAVQQGATYAVVDAATSAPVSDVVIKKEGADLVIELNEVPIVQLEQFYADNQAAYVGVAGPEGELQILTASSSVDAGTQVVWSAEGSVASVDGSVGRWMVGLGGSLGRGGGNSAPVQDAVTGTPVTGTLVTGTLVAGQVVPGNGLTVEVNAADGNFLGSSKVSDKGTYVIDIGNFTGVLFAKVVDANDGPDYMDEATILAKDLNATLMSVATASGDPLTLNITPLTTIAARKAGLGANGTVDQTLTESGVKSAIEAVQEIFELDDINTGDVATTVDVDGKSTHASANDHGKALAALSGMDKLNGDDSAKTLAMIVSGMRGTSTAAALTDNVVNAIKKGASEAETSVSGLMAVASIASLPTDTGRSDSDMITNEASQDFSGTYTGMIAPNEQLKVSVNGGDTWFVADLNKTDKTWALTKILREGTNEIQVAVFDLTGNSGDKVSQEVTLDTTPPVDTTPPGAKVLPVTSWSLSIDDGDNYFIKDPLQTISGRYEGVLDTDDEVRVSSDSDSDGGGTWFVAQLNTTEKTWEHRTNFAAGVTKVTVAVLKKMVGVFLCVLYSSITFANLAIKNGEVVQLDVGEVVSIDGDLSIESGGTLSGAASSIIYVTGNWGNSGTYTHGDGAVHFTGSSSSQISGASTFYTLVSDFSQAGAVTGKKIIFESGTTQAIKGLFQVKGNDSVDLIITASTPGSAATFDLNGATVDASNLNVKDSSLTNFGVQPINPASSVDSGNNKQWFVVAGKQQSLVEILEDSASVGGSNNANNTLVTLVQLQALVSNANASLLTMYQKAIAAEAGFNNPPTVAQVQAVINTINAKSDAAMLEILEDSASVGGSKNANGVPVSLAQLQLVATDVNASLMAEYVAAINQETSFSKPPTFAQIQTIIERINGSAVVSAQLEVLEDSASAGGGNNANLIHVSSAQLGLLANNVHTSLLANYQAAVKATTTFSNPPTKAQVQGIIDQANATYKASVMVEILEDSASSGGSKNANGTSVSLAQLQVVVTNVNVDLLSEYQVAINAYKVFSNPPTAAQVQQVINLVNNTALTSALAEVLEDSASTDGANNANNVAISLAQLNAITGLKNVEVGMLNLYQRAIQKHTAFSNPVTVVQVLAVVDVVNRDYSSALVEVLEDSVSTGGASNSNGTKVSLLQLKALNLMGLQDSLLSSYQNAIASEAGFDNPPTSNQLQNIINTANAAAGVVDVARSPIYSAGVTTDGQQAIEDLMKYELGLSKLRASIDSANSEKGFSVYVDDDLNDSVGYVGSPYQVDGDDNTLERYIDIDGDNKADHLWNPNKNTLDIINLIFLDEASDVEKENSARPTLDLSGPSGHPFRLWGTSGKEFVAVTGWKIIPVSGQITLTKDEYIKQLDLGSNTLVMRGSYSLPMQVTVTSPVSIEKSANRKQVSVGNTVTYTVTLENTSSITQTNVGLTDKLPQGFRYVEGSARYKGLAIEPVKMGGDGLHFVLSNLPVATTVTTLQYQLAVGTGVNFGTYTNTAVAVDTMATTVQSDDMFLSTESKASVKVVPDALFDLSTIIGKVFHDKNQDGLQSEGEEPIANARLLTSAGQQIQVDKNGLYHVPNVAPGRLVIQLDMTSLVAGAKVIGRTSKVVDVRPGIPHKVNFAVQMPNNIDGRTNNTMDIQQLEEQVSPMLNVASSGSVSLNRVTGQFDTPLQIRAYSNYAAFIHTWTVDISEVSSGRVVKSFSGDRISLFDPILWDGIIDVGFISLSESYAMTLTVQDRSKRKAATSVIPVDIKELVVGSGVEEGAKSNVESVTNAHWLRELTRVDRTDYNDIPVTGKGIEISGVGFSHVEVNPQGVAAFLIPHAGRSGELASDTLQHGINATESTTQLILPMGKATLAQSGIDRATVIHKQEIVVGSNAPNANPESKQYVLVGIADVEAGSRTIRGNLETATSGASRNKELVWLDGKVQLYFKGMIGAEHLVTASIDTERGRDYSYSDIDMSKSYAVYGDDSSISNLAAETDGMLYLLVEKGESWAKWGKINPSFNRTHLATFQRSLQGAQAHYESSVSDDGQSALHTQVDIFDARVAKKRSYVEYSSPTGSLFYLKHTQVSGESVQIRVETRDPITGNLISTQVLSEGSDYALNAAAGRVLLNQPLEGTQSGNDVNPRYLVIDYTYQVIEDWEKGVAGGAIQQTLTDQLEVGFISIKEDQENAEYNLTGADATIYLDNDKKHKLAVEYGQSESRVSPRHVSTDGGLTWGLSETPISSADSSAKGRAFSMRGQSQFIKDKVSLSYYYRNIGTGYSSEATRYQKGWEAVGQNLNVQVNKDVDVVLKHDSQWRKGQGDVQANNQVGAKTSHVTSAQLNAKVTERLRVGVIATHQTATEPDATNQAEANYDADTLALQSGYQVSDDTDVTLKHQVAIKGEGDDYTAVGMRHRISENVTINGGATFDAKGDSAYAGANYEVEKKLNVQTGVKYGADNRMNSTVGVRYAPVPENSYRVSISDESGGNEARRNDLTFGAGRQINESTSVDASTSMTLAGETRRSGHGASVQHELDNERTLRAGVSTYEQQTKEEQSDGYDLNMGMDINKQWAFDAIAGQGYVHRLDGGRDKRHNMALGTAYVRRDSNDNVLLSGLARYEFSRDSGQSNTNRRLIKTALKGKYNQDITLFGNLDWSNTKDRHTGVVEARNNQFDLGFAFRPVVHDELNVIAKYSWIDESKPSSQNSYSNLQAIKGHVLSTDILYDLNSRWSFGGRFALRNAQETVANMPETDATTSLSTFNSRYYLMPEMWASGELRSLKSSLSNDRKNGFVVEIGHRFDNNIEFATGYNWAGYNTDLTNLDYESDGVYVRFSLIME